MIVHYRSVIVKSNDGHHIINCQLQSESSTVMLGHPSTLCGIAWPSNTSLFLKQNLKKFKKKNPNNKIYLMAFVSDWHYCF